MSVPNYMRQNPRSPMSIVISAEEITFYLFQITANDKQFPKALRYTLSSDIRNTCLKLNKSIHKAMSARPMFKEDVPKRNKRREKVYDRIIELKSLIMIAYRVAYIKNLEHLATLLTKLEDDYDNWKKNDHRRNKDLPSYEEYRRKQDIQIKKAKQAEYLNSLKSELTRGDDGFIHLTPAPSRQ